MEELNPNSPQEGEGCNTKTPRIKTDVIFWIFFISYLFFYFFFSFRKFFPFPIFGWAGIFFPWCFFFLNSAFFFLFLELFSSVGVFNHCSWRRYWCVLLFFKKKKINLSYLLIVRKCLELHTEVYYRNWSLIIFSCGGWGLRNSCVEVWF